MKYMREQILEILNDINDEIGSFDGESLFDEGLIDSLVVIDLVAELNDAFDINITAKYIVEDNFKTVDRIVALVESLAE